MSKKSAHVLPADMRAIQRAKCQSGERTEYRIEGYPGLVLRCSPNGNAVWYAVYTVQNGSRAVSKRLKIGERNIYHYTAAGDIAAKHLKMAREGIDPGLEKQLARVAITLGDMAQKRIDAAELAGGLKASTVEQQRALTKLFFKEVPGIKDRPADKITAPEMRAALQSFVAKGMKRPVSSTDEKPKAYSDKTRDLIKMALSAAYKWGQDQGFCETNPLRDIRNASEAKRRTNFAGNDDIRKLWAACSDEGAPLSRDMRDVLRLTLLTGQRRSEVAGMRASHLDLTRCMWTMPGDRQEYRKSRTVTVHGPTKNGREQRVPLSPEALAIVQGAMARADGKDRLFNVTPGAVTMAMRRLREKYDIGDVTVHSLRRTIANWAGEQRDIRLEAIKDLHNHKPPSNDVTSQHYRQVRVIDEVRELLNRWGAHVAKVVGASEATGAANVVALRA